MALDWLFQGSPPASVTGTASGSTELPAWYQDYVKQLVMRSSEIAGQPYQPYTGQRIAGFTPMQQQAQDMAQGAATNWQPYMQGAQNFMNQAGGAMGQAPQYFQQGAGLMGQGANLVNQGTGYFGQGANLVNQGAGYFGQGSNYMGQGAGMIRQGGGPAYAGISNYMNPYQRDVLSQIGEQASRNLTENILPNINTTFTGGGTFGGTRHGDFTNRAIRDTQKAVSDAVGQGLYSGWTQAGQFSAADQNRMLQAGQGMGQIGQGFGQFGQGMGQLGGQMGNFGQGMTQAGGQMGNLGQGMGQLGQGFTQLGQNYGALGGQMGALGQLQQQGDIAGMGAVGAAGAEQQQLGQRSLDLAYQDFMNQTQYPFQQAGFMADIIRGTTPSMGKYVTETQTYPYGSGTPSPLQQFSTYAGMFGGLGELL